MSAGSSASGHAAQHDPFHVKQTAQLAGLDADKAEALRLTPVSRETGERLDAYVALLLQWQPITNLISSATLPRLWTRHIADSLQLLEHAQDADRWVDIGSGGGCPGIPLACALADRPNASVKLVERNAKKAAFLREALRVTGGAGSVTQGDIEDNVDKIAPGVQCVTARAVAPLSKLLQLAEPFMVYGATALFLKGQNVGSELTEASTSWNIAPVLHPSRTGDGWIVQIDLATRK